MSVAALSTEQWNSELDLQEEMEMGFVVEHIPEAAKEKFPFVNNHYSSRWVIDHDRDAFMAMVKKFGGGYEGTSEDVYFSLYWQGELISITAEKGREKFTEDGAIMNWRVHHLKIPPVLLSRREEVLQLIRDAFTSIGWGFDGDQYRAVNVEFDLSSDR